jgi:hypothetical protein
MRKLITIAALILAGCASGEPPTAVASDRDTVTVEPTGRPYQPTPIECEQIPGTQGCPLPYVPSPIECEQIPGTAGCPPPPEPCTPGTRGCADAPIPVPREVMFCPQDSGCTASPYIPRQ